MIWHKPFTPNLCGPGQCTIMYHQTSSNTLLVALGILWYLRITQALGKVEHKGTPWEATPASKSGCLPRSRNFNLFPRVAVVWGHVRTCAIDHETATKRNHTATGQNYGPRFDNRPGLLQPLELKLQRPHLSMRKKLFCLTGPVQRYMWANAWHLEHRTKQIPNASLGWLQRENLENPGNFIELLRFCNAAFKLVFSTRASGGPGVSPHNSSSCTPDNCRTTVGSVCSSFLNPTSTLINIQCHFNTIF